MRGCLYEVKHPTLVGMSGISYLSEIPAENGEFRFVKKQIRLYENEFISPR